MKKFAPYILIAALLAGVVFAGCGSKEETSEETTETTIEETSEEETEEETGTESEAEEETETEAAEEAQAATEAEKVTQTVTEAPKPVTTEAPKAETPAQTAPASSSNAASGDIYAKCVASGAFGELVDLDAEYLFNYYGIDTSTVAEFAAGEALDVTNADSLMIFKAASEADAAVIKANLEEYKSRKIEELKNYNPEQCGKVEKGVVAVKGVYAYIVVCDNSSEVVKTIEGLI